MNSSVPIAPSQQQQHEAVVLFYRYMDPDASPACRWLHQHSDFYLPHILQFQKELCNRLNLKGRILLAAEGINGTLSAASTKELQDYREAMEAFDLIGSSGYPPGFDNNNNNNNNNNSNSESELEDQQHDDDHRFIFRGIDWKESFFRAPGTTPTCPSRPTAITEPFPNLKISLVKELVSSGGAISVEDLKAYGGAHLTPEEFHAKLSGCHDERSDGLSNPSTTAPKKKDVVLIDVRNTFEHAIGHFVHPDTQEAAMNPEMVTFSTFDSNFCEQHAPALQDKTVLMYCTGGIRCEKASAMLKKRGCTDVYQLQGGIHRYLETYGEAGYFQGRNFQFDQRVSLTPGEHYQQHNHHRQHQNNESGGKDDTANTRAAAPGTDNSSQHVQEDKTQPPTVVGKCMQCNATDFDELSGSRICTVCRDLVLVCRSCQTSLREYHCRRHAEWKLYYTFLEVFDKTQLEEQKKSMETLLATHQNDYSKHVRKTLRKQIEKLRLRIVEVDQNPDLVQPNAPRRCRSCREPHGTVCNGFCWGFWKTAGVSQQSVPALTGDSDESIISANSTGEGDSSIYIKEEPILEIHIGDAVRPGPHWNDIRYGNPMHPKTGEFLEGTVAEVKSWGTGSTELDCVAVEWNDPDHLPRRRQVQIYRWGAKAVNGARLYDVARCH